MISTGKVIQGLDTPRMNPIPRRGGAKGKDPFYLLTPDSQNARSYFLKIDACEKYRLSAYGLDCDCGSVLIDQVILKEHGYPTWGCCDAKPLDMPPPPPDEVLLSKPYKNKLGNIVVLNSEFDVVEVEGPATIQLKVSDGTFLDELYVEAVLIAGC